jgi:hypothetical protein
MHLSACWDTFTSAQGQSNKDDPYKITGCVDYKRYYQLNKCRVVRIMVGDRHRYGNNSNQAEEYKEPANDM